jgi:PAS domain S-box-containing protein
MDGAWHAKKYVALGRIARPTGQVGVTRGAAPASGSRTFENDDAGDANMRYLYVMRIGPFEVPAWLAPVDLAEPERRAISRATRAIFLAALAAIFATIAHIATPVAREAVWLMIAGLGAALAINHRGAPEWAFRIGLLVIFSYTAILAWSSRDGFRTIYFLVLACLLMTAAVLLRPGLYCAFSMLVLVFVAAAGVKEIRFVSQGGQMLRSPTTNTLLFDVECIFFAGALTSGLLAGTLRNSFRKVHETSRELAAANIALQSAVEAERRQVLAIRQSEERNRMLAHALQSADDCISITDTENRILFVNHAFLRTYGYRSDELVGQHIRMVRSARTPSEVQDGILPATLSGNWHGELWNRAKDGREFPVFLTTSVVHDTEGRNIALVGIAHDITESKRTEEDQAKLQAQLHHAQRMESVGRLAGGVAHDFNNLLTVINGYSQMMLARLDPRDPLRAAMAEIHKAGDRAVRLTRQLLAFSRKQVLEPRVLDLNRVVEEMQRMLERLVGEDVEVQVALHADRATVHADPHQFEQVIMNLAVNARDAMPGGGKLSIETAAVERDESYAREHPDARAGRYVMVSVSDTGVGMDEETEQRIFEPFFTTKEAGKGTGLGLPMVQGIVAQSGGHIEVHSQPGQGTTFKVYLPALAEAAADDGMPEIVPALGGQETVLVVEDQAEVRGYTVAVLKTYGYRVIEAEDADDALRCCESERGPIHLVLTDVVMPRVSGRELADRLKKLQPGIKVMFMSGYTGDVILRHGVSEEGVSFIQKPFSPEELAGRIRALLGPALHDPPRLS